MAGVLEVHQIPDSRMISCWLVPLRPLRGSRRRSQLERIGAGAGAAVGDREYVGVGREPAGADVGDALLGEAVFE